MIPVADDVAEIARRMKELEDEKPCPDCGIVGWLWGEYSKSWLVCSKCSNKFNQGKPEEPI